MKNDFKKFVLSLYKPVKFLTFVMIGSMIISQILDLVKQYIVKGIIDLPSMENFHYTYGKKADALYFWEVIQ